MIVIVSVIPDGMKGSGSGTGEPRERRNTDWARRNTWRVKEIDNVWLVFYFYLNIHYPTGTKTGIK